MGKKELRLPTGYEEPFHELWSLFRNSSGCFPLLHTRNGQGPENVPIEVELVVACHAIFMMIFIYDETESSCSEEIQAAGSKRRLIIKFNRNESIEVDSFISLLVFFSINQFEPGNPAGKKIYW